MKTSRAALFMVLTPSLSRCGVCVIIEMEVIRRIRGNVLGRNIRTAIFVTPACLAWVRSSHPFIGLCRARDHCTAPKLLLSVLLLPFQSFLFYFQLSFFFLTKITKSIFKNNHM